MIVHVHVHVQLCMCMNKISTQDMYRRADKSTKVLVSARVGTVGILLPS